MPEMPQLPRQARLRLASLTTLLVTPIVLSVISTSAWSQTAPTGAADTPRYTDATPDGMIDAAVARALRPGATDADALAAMATIDELASRAIEGHATQALARIGSAGPAGVRDEALLLEHALSADEGTAAGVAADKALGVATDVAVLGPFRDTGGGLGRLEGPESGTTTKGVVDVSAFADRRAHYAWGTVDVAWRSIPPAYAQSSGFPLDVFVSPRKESCTLVATTITTTSDAPIVVRLAASGQARLMFDGAEIGRSEDVNASGLFDRLAGKVTAPAGPHLVSAKICTGALDDRGAVRLRFTDATGAPLALEGNANELRAGAQDKKAPLRPQPIETPLVRALGAHREPGADAGLDEAMLRTLAGADDLRSPRAPGVLDALVRGAGNNADRLAILGWIAPSGANRSGWFNRARELARKDHDARTESFVSRRLVAEHLNARMGDWAMAELRGSHLDTASDNEAILLRAMTKVLLGTDALNSQALQEVAPFGRQQRTTAPTSGLAFLARVAGAFDPALARTAHQELAARGQREAAWIDAEAGVGKEAVVKAAMATFAGSLGDAEEGIAIAQAVSAAGDHRAAQALFGRMVEWAPNRAEAFSGLANEVAAVEGARGTETVLAALKRARDLAPGEARTRAELSLRTRGDKAPEPPADEKYLVSSASILARRLGVPTKGTDVADRQIYFLRAVSMHDDNRVSQLIHYAREIIIAPRTDDELYEDIPSEGDLTEILRARVHKKDGATAFPTEEHNEGSRPRIRWPELSPGDTVEVAIRAWTSTAVGGRGDAPFYFMDFAGAPSTHPTLYNEDVIEFPRSHPIWVDVIGAPPGSYARSEHDEGSRHVMRLVWTKPPTVADEPLAPKLSETTPLVVGSTFHTWADFRAWYAEAVKGFTDPDDEVKHLAAELTKGKTSREDKLKALFDFVSDDIRYVNYVSGEWWLPNRPQQLLARREGDCDDKALLLITLLKAVNIEAEEVMVQTRLTAEPSVLLAKNAAVPMFDHGIAFLPGPGPNGGRYLDATSPQSRLGPVPSMDARAVALRMAGPPVVVTLPNSSPDDHGADVTWSLTLKADGSAEMTGEETHMGDGAFWLRTNLREPDAREQYVEDNLVAPWFPSSEVDKKIDFKGDLPDGRAWVKYSAHSQGLARHESGELVVPIAPSQTLASQLAPLLKRTLPVVLPPYLAPMHQQRSLKVIAAPGFAWVDPPAGGVEDGGEFGKAELTISRDPHDARAMLITRRTSFDASTIPVEKYGAWRAWLQRVDALMHKTVRMAPVGGGK
jgi:hypothetical protein